MYETNHPRVKFHRLHSLMCNHNDGLSVEHSLRWTTIEHVSARPEIIVVGEESPTPHAAADRGCHRFPME